jgi:hypothetical protein
MRRDLGIVKRDLSGARAPDSAIASKLKILAAAICDLADSILMGSVIPPEVREIAFGKGV